MSVQSTTRPDRPTATDPTEPRDGTKTVLAQLKAHDDAAVTTLASKLTSIIRFAGYAEPETCVLWGVKLLAERESDAARIILAKFLRAKDNDVDGAAEMLRARLEWQRTMDLDAIAGEDFGTAFAGHDMIIGEDLEGRPLWYSRFGTMDTEQVFGDPQRFLRWRVQLMEKALARLQPWTPGKPETIVQVHDYADCALFRRDPRQTEAIKLFTTVMGANFPETKGKTIFINFPAFFGVLFGLIKPFIPAKTQAKFVMLGPVSPERGELMVDHGIPPHWCPQRYGGLLPEDSAANSTERVVPAELLVLTQGKVEKRSIIVPSSATSAAAVDVSDGGASPSRAGGVLPTTMCVVLRVLDKDVRCQVTCSSFKASATQLFDGSAVPLVLRAEQGVVRLELNAAPGSTLTFTFDNAHSRFFSKTVLFGCAPATTG